MNLFEIDYKLRTDRIDKDISIYEDSSKMGLPSKNGKTLKIPVLSSSWLELSDEYWRHISLFPNNILLKPERDLTTKRKTILNEFKKIIDNTKNTERTVLNYINQNRHYEIIASVLKKYDFGHHGRYLFREFQLGTSYKADYLIIGGASGGLRFIFIELENVYGNITMSNGEYGETIRKGINQVNDWMTWLESNFSNLREIFEKQKGEHEEFPKEILNYDNSRINYLVIAGRRKDFNEKTYRLNRRNELNNIRVMHYDNLIESYDNLIKSCAY